MPPNVASDSWDWNGDYNELTSSGAVPAGGGSSKIPISSHSSGYSVTTSDMGRSNAEWRITDSLGVSQSCYLIFWPAVNAQGELTAKNIVTVGAVNDEGDGGVRSPVAGTMSTLSSWGPRDDSRIKPYVVANGLSVYSPIDKIDTVYASRNGTSMATPSAALLAQSPQQVVCRYHRRCRVEGRSVGGCVVHP